MPRRERHAAVLQAERDKVLSEARWNLGTTTRAWPCGRPYGTEWLLASEQSGCWLLASEQGGCSRCASGPTLRCNNPPQRGTWEPRMQPRPARERLRNAVPIAPQRTSVPSAQHYS